MKVLDTLQKFDPLKSRRIVGNMLKSNQQNPIQQQQPIQQPTELKPNMPLASNIVIQAPIGNEFVIMINNDGDDRWISTSAIFIDVAE